LGLIHTLEFSHLVEYDTRLTGISLGVKIGLGNSFTEFTSKIDTGATDCIFAGKYGEQIGLDIESGTPVEFSTATGTFKTYQHWVTLSVLTFEFDAAVCFVPDEHFRRNVLGRIGFLNQFIIGLNDYEGRLYLKNLAKTWQQ
jgi:hypothetical protein